MRIPVCTVADFGVGVQLVHKVTSAAKPPLHGSSPYKKRPSRHTKSQEGLATCRLSRQAAKIPAATGAFVASRTSSTMCRRTGDKGWRPLVELAAAAHL